MMSMKAGPSPGYTANQIQQFYDRINLPQHHRHAPGPQSTKIATTVKTGIPFLSALQRHSLSSIPFENLDLHYSTHHDITITPQHLFSKIVTRKNGKGGRGGYCMENNTLFANVLRGLGFDVVSTGARISSSVGAAPEPLSEVVFGGWSHMLNIVSFSDTEDRYFVDVGFGFGGATRPVLLEHDDVGALNVAPDMYSRLVRASIPGTASRPDERKLWVYEKRNGDREPFTPCYCFADIEFLDQDFEIINFWTSTARTSWFTYAPVCVKMVLDDEGEEIVGSVQVFNGKFKKRVLGKKEESLGLRSEEDRIRVLEHELGIPLDEDEREGILGMVSAL